MTPEQAFDMAVKGICLPSRRLRRTVPTTSEQLQQAKPCASCTTSCVPVETGWGTNWTPVAGGNGLCRKALNGVHWP